MALCLTLTPTVAFANGADPESGGHETTAPEVGGTTPGDVEGPSADGGNADEPKKPDQGGDDTVKEPVITDLTVTRDSETTATITFYSNQAGNVAIIFKGSDGKYGFYQHDRDSVTVGKNTIKIEEENNVITGTDAYEIAVYFVEDADNVWNFIQDEVQTAPNPLDGPGAVKGRVPAVHTCASTGAWQHDKINHWKLCDNCKKEIEKAAHTGGTASCADKAVCDICKQEYGELSEFNHKNLVKTEAKPATYTEAGNVEYWHCEDCDKYFSDAAGTTEITQESTIIPKLESKPGGGTVTPSVTKSRVAGDDRFETAIKVADKLKSELGVVKFNNIVVANSDEFADALSATALAADKDAPILVVNKNNESTVKNYITNNLNKGGNVYIIGGTAVVSESFEKSLTNCKVTRLGGDTRYETGLAVADEFFTNARTVVIASGDDFPDGLTGGVLANAMKAPLMLVNQYNTTVAADFVDDNSVRTVIAIGGTTVIPDATLNKVA